MSLVFKMLQTLEKDGYSFSLREDGRFLVKPQPEQDSPVYKFCQKYRELIVYELWLRPVPLIPTQGRSLEEQAQSVFGAPADKWAMLRKLWKPETPTPKQLADAAEAFGDPPGVWAQTAEQLLADVSALFQYELGHLPLAEQHEVGLRVLARVIALLGSQGLEVQQSWAIRAFLNLGQQAMAGTPLVTPENQGEAA